MSSNPHELRVMALTGNLGYGYRDDSLQNGVRMHPHMIGADNGSTDPGPYYLGSGEQLTKPAQVKRDLRGGLLAARSLDVPLIIGSAGTAGGQPHVESLLTILRSLAVQESLSLKVAVIQAEIEPSLVHKALDDDRIRALPGVPALSHAAITESVRIVGQMGVEPIIEALEAEVDVVVAGRACDTAIYAALPIMMGFDPGLAYHLAKILECGAQAAIPLAANDCMIGTLSHDSFTVTPLAPDRRITTASVAAHTMYEQADPNMIVEPDGRVDLSSSRFEQVDDRTVRVSGSRWIPDARPSVKLEGARGRGFRTIAIAGVRDPFVMANLEYIERAAEADVARSLMNAVPAGSYRTRVIAYGRDGIMGQRDPAPGEAHELGLVIEATASTQGDADAVLALMRSSMLHCAFPGRKATAGNLAFPYSPSDIRLGQAYDFSLYHQLFGLAPRELFTVETLRL